MVVLLVAADVREQVGDALLSGSLFLARFTLAGWRGARRRGRWRRFCQLQLIEQGRSISRRLGRRTLLARLPKLPQQIGHICRSDGALVWRRCWRGRSGMVLG